MVDNMGQVVKEKVTRLIEQIELKLRVVILLMSHKDRAVISQLKTLGMDKVEMGEMKIEMIKRSTEILGLVLEKIAMKSDTEDSYEFEITPQQLSQVTPGGGVLKIKLSKKKPLKITAGAPDRQSETIPMELERTRSSKQSVLSSHIDTSSESSQPKRGAGAPLFITPIHPKNNVKPQKGTSIKEEDNLRGSTNHRLAKQRVTQVQGKGTQESQRLDRVNIPPGNGGGGDPSGGTSGDQRFPGEGRGPPKRNGHQKGRGGDDDPDPSDDGDGDDFSSSTDSSVPRKRKQKGPKYVYVLQGPPGPKGQEGQPGQAGRDGRDGQNLSLTKELEETLKAHKPNLDTTGLENSFDQFG